MQIKEISIYGYNGEKRTLSFNIGDVNIITGDSKTGKSVVGDIIDYCLGGDSCDIAVGIVRDTVAWYGLLLQFENERIFVARENPPYGQQSTNKCYYEVGKDLCTPETATFSANTTNDGIEKMLTAKIGINENLNIPPIGQTRQALEANIRHSLIYCFQKQTEVAAKTFLFHRQSEDYMTQTIKDTLPYFLGVIKEDALALENERTIIKRQLSIAKRQLEEVKLLQGNGLQKAVSLLSEALTVGLIEDNTKIDYNNYNSVRTALTSITKWKPTDVKLTGMDRLSQLQQELYNLELELSNKGEDIRNAEELLKDVRGYTSEVEHQKLRLQSIGVYDAIDFRTDRCPLCSEKIKQPLPNAEAIKKAVEFLSNNLNSVTKDRPKLRKYIDEVQQDKEKIKENINNIKSEIDGIYNENADAITFKDLNARRAKVVGRISLWLESVYISDGSSDKQQEIDRLDKRLQEIESLLDKDEIEERKQSVLRRISEDMSNWAKFLDLEHCENPFRLDMNKVTAVVDKPERPVSLQQLGSGSNWVGVHLITYLALHKHFIRTNRPVPQFLFIDQPSQVYFPSEVDSKKKDISKVKRIYEFIFNRVKEAYPNLQLIIVDHADIANIEFQDAVIERWSEEGLKLIPDNWKKQ